MRTYKMSDLCADLRGRPAGRVTITEHPDDIVEVLGPWILDPDNADLHRQTRVRIGADCFAVDLRRGKPAGSPTDWQRIQRLGPEALGDLVPITRATRLLAAYGLAMRPSLCGGVPVDETSVAVQIGRVRSRGN